MFFSALFAVLVILLSLFLISFSGFERAEPPPVIDRLDRSGPRFNLPESSIELQNDMNCTPSELKTCDLDDGSQGRSTCFACKQAKAVCVHFERDYVYLDDEDAERTIPANSSETEGYCLDTKVPGAERSCNVNTGRWILAKLDPKSTSYGWLCLCRYPAIVSQETLFSDCDVTVSCGRGGRLKSLSVNPFLEGECVCGDDRRQIPDRSDLRGPFCRDRTFFEFEEDPVFVLETDLPVSRDEFPALRAKFKTDRPRKYPSPCRYDPIAREMMAEHNSFRNQCYPEAFLDKSGAFVPHAHLADYSLTPFKDVSSGVDYLPGIPYMSYVYFDYPQGDRKYYTTTQVEKDKQHVYWVIPVGTESKTLGFAFGTLSVREEQPDPFLQQKLIMVSSLLNVKSPDRFQTERVNTTVNQLNICRSSGAPHMVAKEMVDFWGTVPECRDSDWAYVPKTTYEVCYFWTPMTACKRKHSYSSRNRFLLGLYNNDEISMRRLRFVDEDFFEKTGLVDSFKSLG